MATANDISYLEYVIQNRDLIYEGTRIPKDAPKDAVLYSAVYQAQAVHNSLPNSTFTVRDLIEEGRKAIKSDRDPILDDELHVVAMLLPISEYRKAMAGLLKLGKPDRRRRNRRVANKSLRRR